MTTEERLSRLEGAYEQVDRRLGDLAQAVAGLRGDLNALRDEVRDEMGSLRSEMNEQNVGLRSEMNSRFNNMYVLAGGAWVTTVGLIIGLYLQS